MQDGDAKKIKKIIKLSNSESRKLNILGLTWTEEWKYLSSY